jgi:hypothetical protein
MNPRLRLALAYAASLCRDEAARIRANLPEEDGAPDASPPRTPDGFNESDAVEWDEDARLIRAFLTEVTQ